MAQAEPFEYLLSKPLKKKKKKEKELLISVVMVAGGATYSFVRSLLKRKVDMLLLRRGEPPLFPLWMARLGQRMSSLQ